MHGPTFMANALACSVSLASLQLLDSYGWKEKVGRIEKGLEQGLRPLLQHDRVKEVRVLGAIGVVECHQSIQVAAIQKYFIKHGVWIRPFRNLIYIMPPFIIEEAELNLLCQVMAGGLEEEAHFVKEK